MALALALLTSSTVHAAQAGNHLNPGTMGPNALPPERGEPAWIDRGWSAELGVATQSSVGPGGELDFSATFPFRVEYAFGTRASLFVEGTPVEAWLASVTTEQLWGLPDYAGLTKGDVRIGGKFLLWGGNQVFPAVGLRALTKTTTGKGVEDRRFINAPGYLFDLLISKRFQLSGELALEAWTDIGFLAWQQGSYGQNDAPAYSGTLKLAWASGVALRAELRGYSGWEGDDRPWVIATEAELPVREGLSVVLAVSHSFRDPVSTDVRAGIRIFGPDAFW